ncbi:Transcription factor TFIIB [Gracilaria domingensis]|nr:Transcription factor TFIIB [Gracilaria domingensis]
MTKDNPRDPYCTPGFISVFRMLSPLREPLFTTSSRTYSGALAEMERLIGDALFAGYIGYNGRAPGGVPLKKEENVDGPERNKSGGDARHTLVAYFEIVELASILGVDKETINLAVRIFRHTASNTSLRNRNVECMATAAFVAAAERRWFEYEAWMKKNNEKEANETQRIAVNGSEIEPSSGEKDPEVEKQHNGKMDYDSIQERTSDIMMLDESITAEKVSMALALDKEETFDKDQTFNKEFFQKPTKAEAADEMTHDEQGAMKEEDVVSEPVEGVPGKNHEDHEATDPWPIPPRHLSLEEISSAANLDVNEVTRYLKVVRIALRKQRPESSSSVTGHMPLFCRRLELPAKTEKLAIGIAENAMRNNICSRRNPVSISAAAIYLACQMEGVRKTQTEICRATNLTEVTLRKVYKELNREHSAIVPAWYKAEQSTGEKRSLSERSSGQHVQEEMTVTLPENEARSTGRTTPQKDDYAPPNVSHQREQNLPVPPPLPPGFGEQTSKSSCGNDEPGPPPPPALPPRQEQTIPLAPKSNSSNPLMVMMSNPAMQAFANAFSMMPQLMMPPPPPPLPPPPSTETNRLHNSRIEKSSSEDEGKQISPEANKGQSSSSLADKTKGSPKITHASNQGRPNLPVPEGVNSQLSAGKSLMNSTAPNSASALPQDSQNVMAGMQSMLGMMQAMQAFQMMQQGQSGQRGGEGGASSMNPWGAMTSLMRLQNPEVTNAQRPLTGEVRAVNHNIIPDKMAKELKSISREPQKSALSSKAPPGSKPDES